MSSCAICHTGFSRIRNPVKHCKRCKRVCCKSCSDYIPIGSIHQSIQGVPRDGKPQVRLCRACITELRKPFADTNERGGTAAAEKQDQPAATIRPQMGGPPTDLSDISEAAFALEQADAPQGWSTAAGTGLQVEHTPATVVASSLAAPPVKRRPNLLTPSLQLPWWMMLALPFAHRAMDRQRPSDKTIGNCYIRVIEADGVLPYNGSTFMHHGPSSNPFAEVAVGQHVVTMRTTRVLSYTVSPAWDEAFIFAVQSPYANLRVTIWHHIRKGKKEPLGEVILPITLFADQKAHDLWCYLRPCGAPAGERGIKQIVRTADIVTGTNVGESIDGVRPKAEIVPPSAVATVSAPNETTMLPTLWRTTAQEIVDPSQARGGGLGRFANRLKTTWNVLRGAQDDLNVVNTTVQAEDGQSTRQFNIKVSETHMPSVSRPRAQTDSAASRGPVDCLRDSFHPVSLDTYPPPTDPRTGTTVDTFLHTPIHEENRKADERELRRRQQIEWSENQEAVPAHATRGMLHSIHPHHATVVDQEVVHHRRYNSLSNMANAIGLTNLPAIFPGGSKDVTSMHRHRPSHVQHQIQIHGNGAGSEVPTQAQGPPVQTSDAIVHDYGLGRLHIQVQLKYDPTSEFWSHLTLFERPPPESRAPFAVAVLVHHWVRLYNVVSNATSCNMHSSSQTSNLKPLQLAPPLTAFLFKVQAILTWKDAVSAMLTLALLTLSLRWPWIVPLLLHILLLRHFLITRLQRDLHTKAEAIRQSIQEPVKPPTVMSSAAIIAPPSAPEPQPLLVADMLPRALGADDSSINSQAAPSIPGMEPGASTEEIYSSAHLEISRTERCLSPIPESDEIGLRAAQLLQQAKAAAAMHQPLTSTETNARPYKTPLRTTVEAWWLSAVKAWNEIANQLVGYASAYANDLAQFLAIERSSNNRVLTKDTDAWDKALTGVGIILNFCLPLVKDVRSTNRSIEPRRISKKEARTTIGAKIGVFPHRDNVSVTGKTVQGQLTSMGNFVSSISSRAWPADAKHAVRPLGAPAMSKLSPLEPQIPNDDTAAEGDVTSLFEILQRPGEQDFAHVITTVPLVAEESPLVSDKGTDFPSLSQLRVARGVQPLKIKLPRQVDLVCLNPNTVIHDPHHLASAAALVAEETDESDPAALALNDAPSKASSYKSGSRNPLKVPLQMAMFVPPPGPPKPPAPGSELENNNNKWQRGNFSARATRYALVLLAVADYLTPEKSIEAMTKLQNTCGDIAHVLEAIPHLFDWTYPVVTKVMVILTLMSIVGCVLIPMRFVAHAIAVSILLINTTPAQYLNSSLQGLISYVFGSLRRGQRAAGASTRWASMSTNRSNVLAQYDVIADVIEEVALYRPRVQE